MKRKSLIYTIMIMALLMALVMSSCEKKPETLEEFVNSNEESMEDIQ